MTLQYRIELAQYADGHSDRTPGRGVDIHELQLCGSGRIT